MTEQLHDDLAALAAQVRPTGLDLPALRQAARRRVRRRRLLVAGPVLLAVVAAGLAVPTQLRDPVDRLTTATVPTPAAEPAHISITATLRAPVIAGVSLSVQPEKAVVSRGTRFTLTWTLAAGSAPVPASIFNYFAREVPADGGAGVIGVSDDRCDFWDDEGRQPVHSCPAPGPIGLQPGHSRTTGLVIADVVESGSIADGTYRFALPVGPLGAADVVLTVTGSRGTGGRPVSLSGRVVANHGRGVVSTGTGAVDADVRLRSARTGETTHVTTSDGSWSTRLAPGRYRLEVDVADGNCPTRNLDLRPGQDATVETTCRDGSSTF